MFELNRYSDKAISLITWMEVLIGSTPDTESLIKNYLNSFVCLPIDEHVAQAGKRLLVTRNTKAFPRNEPGVRIPYQL